MLNLRFVVALPFLASLAAAQASRNGPGTARRVVQRELPTGLARTALTAPGFDWDSLARPTFTVYAEHGSLNAERLPALAVRVAGARTRTLGLLGERSFAPHLRVFYVDSRDRLRALTGAAATGWTEAPSHTVIVVANPAWQPLETHEIMHAVSLALWGDPRERAIWGERGTWLVEGLAAAAEDRCQRVTGRQAVAAIARRAAGTALVPLDSLVTAFGRQDDLVAYLEAGALVEYLLARSGPAALRRVWTEGPDSIPRAYGRPLAALSPAWRRWLAETPSPARAVDVAALQHDGCGYTSRN